MSDISVGSFAFQNGILSGPLNYMEDRGYLLFDAILEGRDESYNRMWLWSPDAESAILFRLQLDYEIWIGSPDWFRSISLN